ncbi:anti-toxin [Aquella oligotrophica]|uniref:Anti-toxin n=1 Tax=Aquella oligotrophica TaxID=2067065 RepID=A0A2I7N637_9NEIS|nr:anti-toxin [Aquella oligotrophica]AUR51926.1 anti-toxin [Aquella oligotrophica]
MNIRLDNELEQKLNYFAHELHTTKTELVKPYILRMLEDLEDYYHAHKALQDEGSISIDELEKEFAHVAD